MPSPHKIRRRPAVALLLVLVMLAMLAAVTTQIVASATRQIAWEAQRGRDDILRANAFSALEVTLSVLAAFRQADGALYGPAQGWSDPLAVAGFSGTDGVEVSVRIIDETGKFGISSMSATALRRYFEDLRISGDASALADCLLDWTDADDNARLNGGERDAYSDDVVPPNRPLKSFDEIRLIKGFKEAFGLGEDDAGDSGAPDAWRLFKGSVSLLGNASQPNINTASPETLEVLAQRGGFDFNAVLNARGGENVGGTARVYRNAGDLALDGLPSSLGNRVGFTCLELRIITRASKGDAALVTDTLVTLSASPGGTSNFPFTIARQRVNAMLQQ